MIEFCINYKIFDTTSPKMSLTFMSLTVIPEIKLTARGVFDIFENRFIDIEAE